MHVTIFLLTTYQNMQFSLTFVLYCPCFMSKVTITTLCNMYVMVNIKSQVWKVGFCPSIATLCKQYTLTMVVNIEICISYSKIHVFLLWCNLWKYIIFFEWKVKHYVTIRINFNFSFILFVYIPIMPTERTR